MRRSLRFLGIVVIVLALAGPAAAILNGKADTAHPYVGILVTELDGQRVPVCSGFLVNSTTFVTAAHCVDDLGDLPAFVSFDQRYTPSSPVVTGTAVPNPGFGSPGADTHDLALIDLDTAVTDRGYAQLPTPGRLASADKKDALTIVGYGAEGFVTGDGKPAPDFRLVRNVSDSRISKVEKTGFNLRMQAGICFGDSGGPVLLGDTDLVVGVASFVNNGRCAGNAFAYRLDTAESLDFLAPYL
ncbi:MAG TPA: S1 family peptidase [Gaiellaceae bacterium]|nr:S1 family peptidase [Gaiellaceae bacterium]